MNQQPKAENKHKKDVWRGTRFIEVSGRVRENETHTSSGHKDTGANNLGPANDFVFVQFSFCESEEMPNDPRSATRPAGGVDCNSDAMAGFAAAHG